MSENEDRPDVELDDSDDVEQAPPPPPEHLGVAGRELWAALHDGLEWEPHELPGVMLACHQADDLRHLELILDRDGGVVRGSTGQPRLSGAFGEIRQARLALSKLLGALAIPTAEEERPMTAAQLRAQRAAQTRWTTVRRLRGEAVDGTSTSSA